MGANAKSLLAAALLAAAPVPSAAAGDACDRLAVMQPKAVEDALRSLSGEVFGKRVDLWTEEDFRNVIAHAEACDGKPEGMLYQVDASQWRHHMQIAANTVVPVSARTSAIRAAYAPRWTWGEVPSCLALVGWRRDPVWHTDNSEELFGLRLRHMSAEQRVLAVGFARECVPVMQLAFANNFVNPDNAEAIARDIEESSAREAEAAKEDPDDLAPALRVEHDGEQVPLAYIGESSRRMVAVANHAEKTGYKLTTEQLIMLSTWADKVRLERDLGPEYLYAESVRKFVHGQMFLGMRN